MAVRRARIVQNPEILGGKPILEGTRLSVEFILQLFEAGRTTSEILGSYPHLTQADLRAVLAFARKRVEQTPQRASVPSDRVPV